MIECFAKHGALIGSDGIRHPGIEGQIDRESMPQVQGKSTPTSQVELLCQLETCNQLVSLTGLRRERFPVRVGKR